MPVSSAIAEYERAVLGERFRRGKLRKARDGHYITGSPAYGYSYVPRRDAVPGHIVVNEPDAELVRRVYGWFTDEQTTIRQVIKRLNAGPDLPRSGRPAWSASTVHHMLADPIYIGTTHANRYTYIPATKPRSPRGACNSPGRRCLKPREQWIAIPVPALVDQSTWDRAQAQLARNAALSFRNNTRHSYLLRCLLTCEVCGLAMYGLTRRASARKPVRQVYECHGKDCILSARATACPSRTVPAEEIEPVVWNHVAGLLADPDQLLAQFDRFDVDPASWSLTGFRERCFSCPRPTHLIRRSSGGRSLTWSVPDVIRLTWRASSSPRPRRSATGSCRLTGRRAAGRRKQMA